MGHNFYQAQMEMKEICKSLALFFYLVTSSLAKANNRFSSYCFIPVSHPVWNHNRQVQSAYWFFCLQSFQWQQVNLESATIFQYCLRNRITCCCTTYVIKNFVKPHKQLNGRCQLLCQKNKNFRSVQLKPQSQGIC